MLRRRGLLLLMVKRDMKLTEAGNTDVWKLIAASEESIYSVLMLII